MELYPVLINNAQVLNYGVHMIIWHVCSRHGFYQVNGKICVPCVSVKWYIRDKSAVCIRCNRAVNLRKSTALKLSLLVDQLFPEDHCQATLWLAKTSFHIAVGFVV